MNTLNTHAGHSGARRNVPARPSGLPRSLVRSGQLGQAYAELIVGFGVVGLFLFGAGHLWRYAEARQTLQSAVRFATWERTVWEPEDNAAEKHALHASDATLARQARIHQMSTPQAWRLVRANVPTGGGAWVAQPGEAAATMLPALRSFGDRPDEMVSVATQSEQQTGLFVGRDPTFNTTTNLELDRNVLRRVKVTFKSQISQSANWAARFFGFPLPDIEKTQSMTLVANPWAASPPVNRIRTERQLLVMSTGEDISGTKANPLAFFGADTGGENIGLGDFVGMVPWWRFVGGANGLGGQYVVKKIGLDAGGANSLIASGGQYEWDSSKPVSQNLLMRAQIEASEYFQPNAVSNAYQKHLNVLDKTADSADPVPRNSVVAGKRKYMAMPLSPFDYTNPSGYHY